MPRVQIPLGAPLAGGTFRSRCPPLLFFPGFRCTWFRCTCRMASRVLAGRRRGRRFPCHPGLSEAIRSRHADTMRRCGCTFRAPTASEECRGSANSVKTLRGRTIEHLQGPNALVGAAVERRTLPGLVRCAAKPLYSAGCRRVRVARVLKQSAVWLRYYETLRYGFRR